MFFDVHRKTRESFEFTPYMDSRRQLHWTLNVPVNAFQPTKQREDLRDTEFNLPKLAFVGFERVRVFVMPDRGAIEIRNWLADAVARAYRSAESGVLDLDCEASEVAETLARFYRTLKGLPDLWPSTDPLPESLSLHIGTVAPSRYEFFG